MHSVHVHRCRQGLPTWSFTRGHLTPRARTKNKNSSSPSQARSIDLQLNEEGVTQEFTRRVAVVVCAVRAATQIAPREEQILTCFMETKGIKLKCSHSVSTVHKYAPVGRRHLLRSASFTSPSVSVGSRRHQRQTATAATATPK